MGKLGFGRGESGRRQGIMGASKGKAMGKKQPTYAERNQEGALAKQMMELRLAQAKEEGKAPGWACATSPSMLELAKAAEREAKAGRAGGAKMRALAGLFVKAGKLAGSQGALERQRARASAVVAKALEGPEMASARAMWVASARATDKAASDGSGLHAHWVAKALENDDPAELSRLLDAGAQAWSLGGGGWHPLDWAWLLNAKACAPRMAREIMPWEDSRKRPRPAGEPLAHGWLFEDLSGSMAGVFEMLTGRARAKGMGAASLLWRGSRAWRLGACEPTGQDVFRLLGMGDLALPISNRPREAMGEAEAMRSWAKWLGDGEAKAWVEAADLFASAAPARPSPAKPRL